MRIRFRKPCSDRDLDRRLKLSAVRQQWAIIFGRYYFAPLIYALGPSLVIALGLYLGYPQLALKLLSAVTGIP